MSTISWRKGHESEWRDAPEGMHTIRFQVGDRYEEAIDICFSPEGGITVRTIDNRMVIWPEVANVIRIDTNSRHDD